MTIAVAYEVSTFLECMNAYPRLMDQPAWKVERIIEETLAKKRAQTEPAAAWDEEPERWDGLA
jgi:hypothetical protein